MDGCLPLYLIMRWDLYLELAQNLNAYQHEAAVEDKAAGHLEPASARAIAGMATQAVRHLSIATLPRPRGAPAAGSRNGSHGSQRYWPCRKLIICKAKDSESGSTSSGAVETVAIVGGLISNPVIGFSLYTLKTTGCGLPPGPGGLLGALEGVSYLAVAGIVAWSLYTKAKTGSGLPNGPFGLLGAVEGLSYLTLLAILVVFGLQFLDRGFIPGPLPGEQCFG